MYLLYIDASGTADLADVSSGHYVLLGLCIHEGTWFALEKRLNGLKKSFCQPGQDFELHASQFACTINEQEEIAGFVEMSWTERRQRVVEIRQARIASETSRPARNARIQKYSRTEPFIHLSRLERSQLLEQSLDLVGGHNGIVLFGEAVSKTHPAVIAGACSPVEQAFEQVVTRFDAYLKRRDDWKLQKGPRRIIDNGLLVLDQDYSTEATTMRQFQGYRKSGTPWGSLRHVMDVPFFAPSDRVSGLQLVDICAYATRRYLDRGAVVGSHEEKNIQRIFQRFDRDSVGKLHGLRHYVPAGKCSCMICQTRRHAA